MAAADKEMDIQTNHVATVAVLEKKTEKAEEVLRGGRLSLLTT
jgi:hypothetical protein